MTEGLIMEMTTVSMTVPKGIAPYLDDERNDSFERNAMLLYPFIQKGIISHGRAAEILGTRKWDLIEYYDSIGIPYLNQSREELLAESATFDSLKDNK